MIEIPSFSQIMNIIINGERKDFSPPCTLDDLIRQHALSKGAFVIELNGEIIQPENYAAQLLKDNDKIEIIRFVGGG